MKDFVISCCSTVDLTEQKLEQAGVRCLFHTYTLDGVEYRDDFGKSMPLPEFYRHMVDGAQTHTSQINMTEYLDLFDEILQSGRDVLHISMSSGMSGTVQAARNAAAIAEERYPGGQVTVVDSLCESCGYGLLVLEAARRKQEGQSLDDIAAFLEDNKLRMEHWFFSTDLTFYIRGGRVPKAAGMIGGLLGLCPILSVDTFGRIVSRAKARSKKRAIAELVNRMECLAKDSLSYDGPCYISHSDDEADAKALAEEIEKRFPKLVGKVERYEIGTVIGCHSGPGTVALFFWGNGRQEPHRMEIG